MDEQQFKELVAQVGAEAAKEIKVQMVAYEAKVTEVEKLAAKNGGVTKEQFEEYKASAEAVQAELKEIARKQGLTVAELAEKIQRAPMATKSIAEVFEENKEEMRKVFVQGSGTRSFMLGMNAKGEYVLQPYDATKAAGPHATIAGVGGGGNVASVTSTGVDAASLLRMGADASIVHQFRNTAWIFPFANLVNEDVSRSFAMYWEETPKQGSSATVAEGGTKPLSQYAYNLVTQPYKKEATIIGITEEFSMDFQRLESDILGLGRRDVLNRVNTAILANIITNATAYNTAAQFATPAVDNVNDFDVIAAMAAQVDNATYGNLANAAFMSTFKKYRMGVEKSLQAEYLNRPEVINNISFVGNPAMGTDQVLVGDFKNYNILLRGGFIIKVGYNGTDFAENRFSIVMEQYYFDYISTIRKVGIVKGPTFADVTAQIESQSISS